MTNTLADYDLLLVALSYCVSVLGALTGLFVANHIRGSEGGVRLGWLLLAAILIGGCAIWAMHFIGMIAYDPGGPMAYDTTMTAASLVAPIAFVTVGLYATYRRPESFAARVVAGTITGLGVAAMHYTGMAAIRVAAYMTYDPVIVAVSVGIAIVAAIAALHIVLSLGGVLRYASALVMGVAVCGMHYTGMAALRIEAASIDVNYFDGALTERMTGIAVVAIVVTACAIGALLAGSRMVEDSRARTGGLHA